MEKRKECEIVQDLLLGYVDNILNKESKKLVEEHLKSCEECQRQLKEINKDIQENENNKKKEIDYLKKIRRKNRIKSFFLVIGVILVIVFSIFLYKFIIVHNIEINAEKSLSSNNFYKESRQVLPDNQAAVIKYYYKDGKYKEVHERYTDSGKEVLDIIYAIKDSDEMISINEKEKKVTIQKGEFTKIMTKEQNLKNVSFVGTSGNLDLIEALITQIGKACLFSIDTDTYEIGRPYYIFRKPFENSTKWEIWIDKQTGLPLKVINYNATREFFAQTDIVKRVTDIIQEYKYDFDVVTDEDVNVPDLSAYDIKYVSDETLFNGEG